MMPTSVFDDICSGKTRALVHVDSICTITLWFSIIGGIVVAFWSGPLLTIAVSVFLFSAIAKHGNFRLLKRNFLSDATIAGFGTVEAEQLWFQMMEE